MIPAVIERCAGIDVGRKFVVVCVMCGDAQATPTLEVRKFSMLTEGLEQLRVWLHQNECTHVVMESTGSYWKPIFNILDDGQLEAVLANSQQVKNLRGHKTDPNDARWLAHLLRHGMIRPSFIPDRDTRELRDLTRRRKKLVECAAEERNRVQRVLQEANIQLGMVLSDVFGESGLNMLDALMNPDASAEQIADLAVRTARKKIPEIRKALEGHRMTEHHRRLIRHSMEHLAFLEEQIAELDREIDDHTNSRPALKSATELVKSVPGIQSKRQRQHWWRRQAPIWAISRVEANWLPGSASVRGTTRVLANVRVARPERGIPGRNEPWWSAPGAPPGRRIRKRSVTTSASNPDCSISALWWPQRT